MLFRAALQQHTDVINSKYEAKETVFQHIVSGLFEMLKEVNPYCRELASTGTNLFNLQEELAKPFVQSMELIQTFKASMNANTTGLTIGGIVSDEAQGVMKVQYKLRGSRKYESTVGCRVEPLLYVLFHPYGEPGWSAQLSADLPFNR